MHATGICREQPNSGWPGDLGSMDRLEGLGARIQQNCAERGLTYADAARELRVHPCHVSLIVWGRRQPSVALLVRLAAWLDCSLDELVPPGRMHPLIASRVTPFVARARGLAATVGRWRVQ